MSISEWNELERIMVELGHPKEIIDSEKLCYIYENLQFDPDDKRPMEVYVSEPDEKNMRSFSFKTYGIRSEIPFTFRYVVDDSILKIASLPPEEQFNIRKLMYSPHEQDKKEMEHVLRHVQIDESNLVVKALRHLVGQNLCVTIDNE